MPTGTARTRQTIDRIGRRPLAATLGLAATGLLLAACGSTSGGTGSTAAGAGSTPSTAASTTATPSVPPGAVLGTLSTPLGTVLVDSHGHTVYVYAADSPGHSNCTGTCLTYWAPITVPAAAPAAVPGVTGVLGEIMRSDGTHQLTVNGWPVYDYSGDTSPGMTSGQGQNLNGGLWWVVSPAGVQIKSGSATSSAPASPKPSASKSSSSGGWA